MKKYFVLIALAMCVVATSFSGCFFLDGCSSCNSEKKNYVEVSSLSELKNAQGDILLTQDIDCEFATISKKACSSINGQGYTIKNAVLNDNAFFETAEILNVNFENITCRAVSSSSISIVASVGNAVDSVYKVNIDKISVENVTVKNSSLVIPESNSTVYAGIFVDKNIARASGSLVSFKNCYAGNVTVEIGGSSDNTKKWSYVYFGGLLGYGLDVTVDNCRISDCGISISGNVSQSVYAGGLLGWFEEYRINGNSITDSYVKDTYINAYAPNATVWAGMAITNTADVCLGGLAGYYKSSGSISQSYSSGNSITTVCSGKAKVGGLAGHCEAASVTSSYVSDNYISGGYCEVGDKAHSVGGLFAYAKDCALTSCFTYNNLIMADETNFISVVVGSDGEHYLSDTTYSSIAGFIASGSSLSATFCASSNTLYDSVHDEEGNLHVELWATEMEKYGLNVDDKLDEFWFGGTQVSCYVTNPVEAGNSQGLTVIAEEVWLTPEEIKSKLNLVDSKWVLENGKAPYLSL